jgi:signal transduction histidine kinase
VNPWRALRARPLLADAALAVLIAIPAMGSMFGRPGEGADVRPAGFWAVLLVLAATAPLVTRRRWPIATLAIVTAALFAYDHAQYPDGAVELAGVVATYSVAVHSPNPRRMRAAAVFLVLLVANCAVLITVHDEPIGEALAGIVLSAIPFVVGDNIKRRRDRAAELEQQAEQAAHQRELEARGALARERAAIARELHDVIAHSMTVMVVQASAARRVLASDPDGAERSIRVIEQTGRDSLVEMRRLLGVLRHGDEAPQLTPQPSVSRIEDLLRDEFNIAVDLQAEGEPRPLPTVVDVSAFRIVQEALTNVRKHAGPSQVRLVVRYRDDALEIRVDDDGRAAPRVHGGAGTGHGLTGMRERAALCGGALDAGPRADGGWSVVARLPYESTVHA